MGGGEMYEGVRKEKLMKELKLKKENFVIIIYIVPEFVGAVISIRFRFNLIFNFNNFQHNRIKMRTAQGRTKGDGGKEGSFFLLLWL